MKYVAIGLVLLLTTFTAAPAQRALTFCDLVRNPSDYNGREVTVRASYHYGFEWQDLYCLDCFDQGPTWLKFSDDLDDASEKALKKGPKGAGVVNLTVRGVFYSGGHYGHQNMYRHQFVATSVRNVVVVVKGMVVSDKKKAAEKRWACGGTDAR